MNYIASGSIGQRRFVCIHRNKEHHVYQAEKGSFPVGVSRTMTSPPIREWADKPFEDGDHVGSSARRRNVCYRCR